MPDASGENLKHEYVGQKPFKFTYIHSIQLPLSYSTDLQRAILPAFGNDWIRRIEACAYIMKIGEERELFHNLLWWLKWYIR